MFNENFSCWRNIFKVFIIITFFMYAVGGFILGLCDYDASIDIIYDDTILDILTWTAAGAFLGAYHLVAGMLILNIVNNVQIINKKFEGNIN